MSRPTHAEACRAFSWDTGLRALGWTARGEVSLGETILDRHASADRRAETHRAALRWLGKDGARRECTFDELARASARFANALRALGIGPGDRVAGYLPRVPETLVAMIGAWKAGAVYVPIFTGFGPDAIAYRVGHSGAKVLCTHWEYRARVPSALPGAPRVVTVTPGAEGGAARRAPADGSDTSFREALEAAGEEGEPARVPRDAPAVLLYTSGSTGPPKGVAIAANFLLAVHPYMVHGVDLRPSDVFWPTGDPGWGYGLVCYMAALALGVGVVCQEAAPAAESALARLAERGVTNLATTPTLLRSIMALGPEAAVRHRPPLRAASSCGEPLNAEVVDFFRACWGVTVMDHYGASELGLPIGNLNAVDMAVKPGSMGLPLPGAAMAVVDDEGRDVGPGVVGHVAMRPDPVGYYALGYWEAAGPLRALARGGFITAGDLARRDADGYFWFEGRADDVIKSAGYRIGPFEVESAILRHPDVAEAAVVGAADALRGQIVKAYVVLKPGRAAHPGLEAEIVDVVKAHLGHHQQPRAVAVVPELPKTETGKIQRFLLRQG